MAQEPEYAVLLIEDEPDAAKLVQHVLLKGTAPLLAVDWAPDLRTGLERLSAGNYGAVLLDLNLPDSSGFETFACVRRQCPDQAVIVLTGQEDEALALKAVRSGADEYLIKSDIRDRFLAQRIHYAIERRNRSRHDRAQVVRKGRVFAFVGAKGGSGTTTLVLNLAAALAKAGESVAALELIPGYGSFAAQLRYAPVWDLSALLKTAAEAIGREQVESCMTDLACGFRALFAPQTLADYCDLPVQHAQALLRLSATLADYVLVDLPSFAASHTAEVIHHASFTTLVVEQDWLGCHAGTAKAPLLRSAGIREDSFGIAIINKTPHVESLLAGDLARQLGADIVGIVASAGDALAANRSTAPLVLNCPDLPFSKCISDMARRFCATPVGFFRP
jgi:Flp pilus assembly CpaE family ATPase